LWPLTSLESSKLKRCEGKKTPIPGDTTAGTKKPKCERRIVAASRRVVKLVSGTSYNMLNMDMGKWATK